MNSQLSLAIDWLTEEGRQMQTGTTLTRFIIEEQRKNPQATGDFTTLLTELTTASKLIGREVNKAGLAETMGLTGRTNVHGEDVQMLDEFANSVIIRSVDRTGKLAALASEEMEDFYPIPEQNVRGDYILVFDPVDGSSNIDVNVSIGTIFSLYRKKSAGAAATLEDFLRKGVDQLCAGYIIYGSSTMLVYTTGHGVHGFTLDPALGEFLLSHENIMTPTQGGIYSTNESNYSSWSNGVQDYVDWLKKGRTARYIGSLVSDFHRNLLKGGVFIYPGDAQSPQGKLRLVYEANPMAFIIQQAGGLATNGHQPILDLQPEELHQRVPLVVGSREDVEKAREFIE